MLIFFVLHNMFLFNPPSLTLLTKILSEAGFMFSSLGGVKQKGMQLEKDI